MHGALMGETPPIVRRRHPALIHAGPGCAQKPSSARPTQLNANRQQTAAATEARVVIVLADDMTRTLCRPRQTLSNDLCSTMAKIRRDEKTSTLCPCCNG